MKLFFCIFAITLFLSASAGDAVGQKKYHLITSFLAEWHVALDYCLSNGWSFASILTKEENDQVLKLIKDFGGTDNFWIGATELGTLNTAKPTFYWMGKNKTVDSGFSDWYVGNPNNPGREDCMNMRAIWDYKWNDSTCTNRFYFICEESPSNCGSSDKDVGTDTEVSSIIKNDVPTEISAPTEMDTPTGIDSPTGMDTPTGFDSPTGMDSPTGVDTPTGIDSPTGMDTPTGIDSPTGMDAPTGIDSPTGMGSPTGNSSPTGNNSPVSPPTFNPITTSPKPVSPTTSSPSKPARNGLSLFDILHGLL